MRKYHIVIDEVQRAILSSWAIKLDISNFGDDEESLLAGMLKSMQADALDTKDGYIHDFTL